MTTTHSPRLLVTRPPERAAGLVDLLRPAGLQVTVAPVIERAAVDDAAGLERLAAARRDLADGVYAWVAVTSVNAVDTLLGAPDTPVVDPTDRPRPGHSLPDTERPAALAEPPARIPAATRWACVGPATRRAVEAHGLTVDVVPASRMTGAGLVEAFPPPGDGLRRVLLPLGDLAAPTLPDGLRAQGWEPDVVTAYRTISRDLPRNVVEQARTVGYDAVVVASGSAAREVAAQIGPQRVVAIGEPSAVASRRAGHDVLAVAARPTDAALAAAVGEALRTARPTEPASAPDPSPRTTAPGDTPSAALTDRAWRNTRE